MADGAPPALSLSLELSGAGLRRGLEALEGFLLAHGVGARARGCAALVLEEVLTNLERHAFEQPAAHRADVSVHLLPDSIELHVVDDGPPFDPLISRPRQQPATLEDARPGGLGLVLMHRFARRLQHVRVDARNHLTAWLDR